MSILESFPFVVLVVVNSSVDGRFGRPSGVAVVAFVCKDVWLVVGHAVYGVVCG